MFVQVLELVVLSVFDEDKKEATEVSKYVDERNPKKHCSWEGVRETRGWPCVCKDPHHCSTGRFDWRSLLMQIKGLAPVVC